MNKEVEVMHSEVTIIRKSGKLSRELDRRLKRKARREKEMRNTQRFEKWRPQEWVGQPDYCGRCEEHPDACHICVAAYEAGASTILKDVVEYMNEPCPHFTSGNMPIKQKHSCDICWREIGL
jgi:hypothetical protein